MTTDNPEAIPGRKGLIASARKALARFPGPMVMATLATGIVIQGMFRENAPDLEQLAQWRLLLVAILGISWLYSLSLIGERHWSEPQRTWVPLLIGFGTLALYYFRLTRLTEANADLAFGFEYAGLFVGLHFFAAYAPFLGYRQPRAFWEYNRRIFVRILAALLFSGTLYLGTNLFFFALSQVVGISFMGILVILVGSFILGIFNTWFFLAGIPEDFDALERQPPPFPRGLKAFAQFVLMPLVVAIGLVLEIWLVQKILGKKPIDEGTAGAFFILGGVGLLTYLLLYPLRTDSTQRWLKIFEKGFFLGLMPLLAAVACAAYRLIHAHGWTPPRYYAIILSLWGLGLCLYFLIARPPGIRWIPISLSLIAFLTTAGPQGPYAVGYRSQGAQLAALLKRSGLQPGSPSPEAILALPADAKNRLLGQMSYLETTYGCESLQPYFGPLLVVSGPEAKACDTRTLNRMLTRDSSLPPEKFETVEATTINFLSEGPSYQEVAVKGFDYYFEGDAIRFLEGAKMPNCDQGPTDPPLCAFLPQERHQLELFWRNRALGKVDLEPFVQGLMKQHYKKPAADDSSPSFYLKPKDLTLETSLPAGRLRITFDQVRIQKRGEQVFPEYVRFSLLFKEGS